MLVHFPSSATLDLKALTSLSLPLSAQPPYRLVLRILLAILASFVLLAAFRALSLCLRPLKTKRLTSSIPALAAQEKKLKAPQDIQAQASAPSPQRRSWLGGLFIWESLPLTLPVSLTMAEKNQLIGRGVGLVNTSAVGSRQPVSPPPTGAPTHQRAPHSHQSRRGTPAFDRPLPALYATEVPVSMAKMIMSRHTFRKPSLRPRTSPSPTQAPLQVSSPRRTPSMV